MAGEDGIFRCKTSNPVSQGWEGTQAHAPGSAVLPHWRRKETVLRPLASSSQHKAMTLAYFYKPRKVHAGVEHVSLLTRAPSDAAFTSSCKMMGKGMLPHIWETSFILNRYFRMKKKTLFFYSNFLRASQNT